MVGNVGCQFSVPVPEKEPTPQTVLGTMFSIATVCSSPPTKQVTVLNDVSCHLAPGTLTCVLGGPSSGKTTLLKVCSVLIGGLPTCRILRFCSGWSVRQLVLAWQQPQLPEKCRRRRIPGGLYKKESL